LVYDNVSLRKQNKTALLEQGAEGGETINFVELNNKPKHR